MMTMNRTLALAAAFVLGGLAPASLPGPASAQSCAPEQEAKWCLTRYARNKTLDYRSPGIGGPVACKGLPQATVQVDHYSFSGVFYYVCTSETPCADIQGSEAWQKFCPHN